MKYPDIRNALCAQDLAFLRRAAGKAFEQGGSGAMMAYYRVANGLGHSDIEESVLFSVLCHDAAWPISDETKTVSVTRCIRNTVPTRGNHFIRFAKQLIDDMHGVQPQGLVFSVDRLLRGLRAQDILTRPDFEKLASDLIQMTRPDGVAVARAWMGDLPAEEML